MQTDLLGRVKSYKLPYNKGLLPLFEAVVNAIHSIEDANNQQGTVDIYIERSGQGSLLADQVMLEPIENFVVTDNGAFGFSRNKIMVNRGAKRPDLPPKVDTLNTYKIGWDYSGVDRCGSDQENLKEARIAAEKKLSEFSSKAILVNFDIVDHSTRRWEEKDKFVFYKGRKCSTHLEINVEIRT